MKKTASRPKLKNFFAPEPSCIVHGAGKKCVTGKAPSFEKKAISVDPIETGYKQFRGHYRELLGIVEPLKSTNKELRAYSGGIKSTDYFKKMTDRGFTWDKVKNRWRTPDEIKKNIKFEARDRQELRVMTNEQKRFEKKAEYVFEKLSGIFNG